MFTNSWRKNKQGEGMWWIYDYRDLGSAGVVDHGGSETVWVKLDKGLEHIDRVLRTDERGGVDSGFQLFGQVVDFLESDKFVLWNGTCIV